MHRILASALVAAALGAGESTFTPLRGPDAAFDTEANAGEWLRPNLGAAADLATPRTRVLATVESVTGGVGLKWVFAPGSLGAVAWEGPTIEGVGVTFYAKAAKPCRLRICKDIREDVNKAFELGTEWKKYDVPWSDIGTDGIWQLVFQVVPPIAERTVVWIDRIGTEAPAFDAHPAIEPKSGPDQTISSDEILLGADTLAKTVARLKAKQPFKIVALGDSVSAGAQTNRGTWGVKIEDGVRFRYFGRIAQLCEEAYGYTGITPLACAHGGWTTAMLLDVADTELMPQLADGDLVVLQSGGNEIMNGKPIAQWKSDLAQIIAKVRTKTDQILVVDSTVSVPGPILDQAAQISAALREIVAEQKVAGADVTRFLTYRGAAFASGLLANGYHPDFAGHWEIGRMIAPLLTGKPARYPDE